MSPGRGEPWDCSIFCLFLLPICLSGGWISKNHHFFLIIYRTRKLHLSQHKTPYRSSRPKKYFLCWNSVQVGIYLSINNPLIFWQSLFLYCCPVRARTWTLLIQSQTCCQLHHGTIFLRFKYRKAHFFLQWQCRFTANSMYLK